MIEKQKYILVVDDEANVRAVFSDVLKREGYRVRSVEDGYKAIIAVEEENFDLILVDLGMPQMNGIQTLENIKKKKPGLPVIIHTEYGSITTAVEAMKKGAIDYLNKPFSPKELKLSIKNALDQKYKEASPV